MRGRRAKAVAPQQASLVPLAEGHSREAELAPAAMTAVQAVAAPATASSRHAGTPGAQPFRHDAPEATFSLIDLCATPAPGAATAVTPTSIEQTVRAAPPSFREIRAGRAAAASRAPIAEVRIPVDEIAGASHDLPPAQGQLPYMDDLVERVRQRTAARISSRMARV